jgi:hypothetical protein
MASSLAQMYTLLEKFNANKSIAINGGCKIIMIKIFICVFIIYEVEHSLRA